MEGEYKQNQTSAILNKKLKPTPTHAPEQELSSNKRKTDLVFFFDSFVHEHHSKTTEQVMLMVRDLSV